MDLLEQSKGWRREAETLLKESKILELLNGFGDVSYSGSYKYDLMLGPDIDLLMVCDKPELSAQEFLKTLINQRFWNGYMFYDWDNFRSPKHPNYPKAYYVGVKGTHYEHRWKIDIWLVDEIPKNIDDSWITKAATGNKK